MSARRAATGTGASIIGLAAIVAVFLALPVATLVGRAVLDGSLARTIGAGPVLGALTLSLATTAMSLVLTVTLGLPLAQILARREFRGKRLVEAIVDLPVVLPPSVAGLGLLLVFGRRGLVGGALDDAGIELAFTTAAVLMAQTFVAAPLFIRSARAGLAGVDRDLEDAARVDGATERDVFLAVTVPLAANALASGLVLAWARSLGEFGATIMFAGNVTGRTQTLPLVVYGEFQGGDLDGSIAAAAILILAALGVLLAVRLMRSGRAQDLRTVT